MNILKHIFTAFFIIISIKIVGQNIPQLTIPTLDRFAINGMCFIPSKNYIVSYGGDIKFWQLSDGRMVKKLAPESLLSINKVVVSPDNKTIALIGTYEIGWVNIEDFSLIMTESIFKSDDDTPFNTAVFSPDGQTLYVGGGNETDIKIWKLPKNSTKIQLLGNCANVPQKEVHGEGLQSLFENGVKSISISLDGKTIFASAGEQEMYAFDSSNGKVKRIITADNNSHTMLPNGMIAGYMYDIKTEKTTIKLYKSSDFKEVAVFNKSNFYVQNIMSFPKSNKCILFNRKEYIILDADTKKLEKSEVAKKMPLLSLAINADEKTMAYCGGENQQTFLATMNLKTQKDELIFGTSLFQSEIIKRDSLMLTLCNTQSGITKILKIQDGGLLVQSLPDFNNAIPDISPKTKIGVFVQEDSLISFNANTSPPQYTFIKKIDGIAITTISKNGLLVATANMADGISVFNVANKKQIAQFKMKTDYNNNWLIFSPDNKRLVAAYTYKKGEDKYQNITCWDILTGKSTWTMDSKEDNVQYSQFKFNENGKTIFCFNSTLKKREALLLDALTGKILRSTPLDVGYGQSEHFKISPDNKTILHVENLDIIDPKTGIKSSPFELNGKVTDAEFLEGGQLGLVTYTSFQVEESLQEKLALFDFINHKILAYIYLYNESDDWAIITPDGHYDATQGAMKKMYYTQSTTLISLDALSEKFYVPKLLGQLLDGNTPDNKDDIRKLKAPPSIKIGIPVGQRNLVVEDEKAIIRQYNMAFEKISLTIEATSSDDFISEIRLYHNGKLVGDGTRNLVVEDDKLEKSKSQKFDISLVEGENVFKAITLNSQKTESSPDEINVRYKAEKTLNPQNTEGGIQLYVMVIGINKYKNPKYNLNYATADATSFKEAIEKGSSSIFSKINMVFIGDDNATKGGITAELDKIKSAAKPQDVFIFYYAGHGVLNEKKEFFLVPHDVTQLYGQDDALAQKALSAKQLQQFSKDIKAQKQLFILDACQSAGALDQIVAARGAAEEKAIAQLARATGTHWLTASGSEQFASEFVQLGHGTFTYVLLEALNGKADKGGDKKITVKELDAYLQEQVPEVTAKYKGTPQYPASYGFGNDFPIGVVKN